MLSKMGQGSERKSRLGGLAGWLLDKLARKPSGERRLALLERIALAPKQSLALIEAEGQRLLVAFSTDGAPVFHALGGPRSNEIEAEKRRVVGPGRSSERRVSW